MIHLLDYGAGNVRSVRNAINSFGFQVADAKQPEEIVAADKLIFPGVGNFGVVMGRLAASGFAEALRQRIALGKPTFGICIALQAMFEGSEEAPGVAGLGIIPGQVRRFFKPGLAVPQIGWNNLKLWRDSPYFAGYGGERLYFVHSFYADLNENNRDWTLATTSYGGEYISAVAKGEVIATQFHPEKSGEAGLNILGNFLKRRQTLTVASDSAAACPPKQEPSGPPGLAKRIIACLDVRANDEGDLVVTKGDQYDVREEGIVRNLGQPVALAERYYREGADEIAFLNITGFRDFPLQDQPMLEVLEKTSEKVFVPLTIGGGIRAFTDKNGKHYSALDVAGRYFRAGADKISIGSDAVATVEAYLRRGAADGASPIEEISRVYGAQAVVISVDPRRVYVTNPSASGHACIKTKFPGPGGEKYCWYQCTVKGGREGRDIDAVQLATICERLGAGEILLNCIDRDGGNQGFDLELIAQVKAAVSIPVIASSGAGKASHFPEVFRETGADAALAAGIFHRNEVAISEVKAACAAAGLLVR
ncbi:MAG: imidazole glycerol phosphate synthase subunit HisF [Desulfobulbaceae bacterium]|jgi:glutamine amidotransferase/cyclase|nr:imidazole glycerol phosphate synthase subunit HisF [Desulfobulbaceae bacterium]